MEDSPTEDGQSPDDETTLSIQLDILRQWGKLVIQCAVAARRAAQYLSQLLARQFFVPITIVLVASMSRIWLLCDRLLNFIQQACNHYGTKVLSSAGKQRLSAASQLKTNGKMAAIETSRNNWQQLGLISLSGFLNPSRKNATLSGFLNPRLNATPAAAVAIRGHVAEQPVWKGQPPVQQRNHFIHVEEEDYGEEINDYDDEKWNSNSNNNNSNSNSNGNSNNCNSSNSNSNSNSPSNDEKRRRTLKQKPHNKLLVKSQTEEKLGAIDRNMNTRRTKKEQRRIPGTKQEQLKQSARDWLKIHSYEMRSSKASNLRRFFWKTKRETESSSS